jgi:serine/threonine protein phosphatase PrpC
MGSKMGIAVRIVAAHGAGEDRAAAIAFGRGHILVLADGAGGRSGGAAAADAVMSAARELAGSRHPIDCCAILESLDTQLQDVGEATAVLASWSDGVLSGASVGDSGAWLIDAAGCHELTIAQRRKPLLGSGALPVAFGPTRCTGRVLIASDGLLNYVAAARIQQLVKTLPLEAVPAALIDAARLPSGALCDDISIIVAE